MVYSSRFVLCVLVDGKPAHELANGVVPIPFGQYALRFRNKNTRRAVVKFTIDGENVSGNGYIIPANSSIDIHRHWDKDATFKFVGLDSPEAVDYGKNGPNDGSKGVIEAKFYLEKYYIQPVNEYHHCYPRPYYPPNYPSWHAEPNIPAHINISAHIPALIWCSGANATTSYSNSTKCETVSQQSLQEGCTVEGVQSGQTFRSDYIDLETDFVLLRCTLKGVPQSEAVAAYSVSNDIYCTNCGAKKIRKSDNFCGVCGRKF